MVGRVRASAGVQDRSSRPRRSAHATGAAVVAAIVELRRSRKLFAWQIALGLDVPRSTVVRILRRVGLHRLALLEPPPVFQRYEFERPGQLVHIDIKKLSKFETQGHRIDGVRHNANAGLGFDSAYRGNGDVIRHHAKHARDFTNKRAYRNRPLTDGDRETNRRKSSVRSYMEHAFGIIKGRFCFQKVRYRGIAKNLNRLHILAALTNLIICKKRLLRLAAA